MKRSRLWTSRGKNTVQLTARSAPVNVHRNRVTNFYCRYENEVLIDVLTPLSSKPPVDNLVYDFIPRNLFARDARVN